MDTKGIILELQWKKKYAVKNGGDDFSSIGVCYMAEPSVDLDWMSFKSYLCQNVGTKEDVTFAYVDSEGDEIPIESECEFQEALKFARQRARRGKAIVLKLDRPSGSETSNVSTNNEKTTPGVTTKAKKMGTIRQSEIKKDIRQSEIKKDMNSNNTKTFCIPSAATEEAKSKVNVVSSVEQSDNKGNNSEENGRTKIPEWFEKEKEKMQIVIMKKFTSVLEQELEKTLAEIMKTLRNLDKTAPVAPVEMKRKKKKISDKVPAFASAAERRALMEGKGMLFQLRSKKRYAVSKTGEDITSIGCCFMPDPSPHLNWIDFRRFLCQHIGAEETVAIGYVDSEGDEIPIESESEFQEALKVARQKARQGKPIVVILDLPYADGNVTNVLAPGVAVRKTMKAGTKTEVQKNVKSFSGNIAGSTSTSVEKTKSTAAGSSTTATNVEKKYTVRGVGPEQQQLKTKMVHLNDCKDDIAPVWFQKEKEKMKNEIVSEVTSQIKREFQQAVLEMKKSLDGSKQTFSAGIMETTNVKKKKRVSDEESSDANAVEQREYKLLRKIEKLQKREKKLEKKLDSKLEKLENRTKRMLEKKSHSKCRSEIVQEHSTSNRKRSDVSVGTYLMDAILLNGGSQADTHIKLGEIFIKVWQIMNTGTLPWTDKTELRLAWGTTGLEPRVNTVKCPILEPGDRGEISVTFKAPEFPGTFESYWHFYHMGVRFGHWLSCTVIVDPKEETDSTVRICDGHSATNDLAEDFETKPRIEHAVDLTVRSKSEESDLEVITNFEKDVEKCSNAEYESDSDSDNVSVISNGISDSDSDDDKFVVVSMPASSTTEGNSSGCADPNITELSYPELIAGTMTGSTAVGNSNHAVSFTTTATTTTTADTTSSSVSKVASDVLSTTFFMPTAEQKNCSKTQVETKESHLEANGGNAQNLKIGEESTSEPYFIKSPFEPVAQSSSQSDAANQPLFDLAHTAKANGNLENIVFAVDMLGKTVPVKLKNKPKKHNSNTPSLHSSGSYPDVCPVSVEESEEVLPESNTTSLDQGNEFGSETASNYTDNGENAQHSNTESYTESGGNIIHILPETLMNGAVNVATSAISTARAVISNLRTIPSRTSYSPVWEPGPPADSSHPSVTAQSLALILDMGFTNKEQIVALLKKHNNDVSKVVSELLSSAENSSTI